MKKILFIFYCIILGHPSIAQVCQSDEYSKLKELFFKNNLAYLPEKNIQLADSTISLLKKKNHLVCDIYWNALFYKGEALIQLADYPAGLNCFHQVIHLAEKQSDYSIIVKSYLFLALIHEVAGRKNDCSHNLDKAIQIINEHDLYDLYAWYCVRYSSYHRILGEPDSALKYAELATIVGNEVRDVRNELDGHLLLGILSKDLETSIRNFERSAELYILQNGYTGAAYQTFNIVSRLLDVNQLDRAQEYLLKAYNYLEKVEEENMDYYQTLSRYFELKKEVFKNLDQLDSALKYSNKYIENIENTRYFIDQGAINDAEIKFAVERERLRTSALQQSSNLLKVGLGVGTIVLLLLGALLWLISSSKKKISTQNQLITSRNTELSESIARNEMLLSEVHHRVKNNLQNIISLIFFKEVNTVDAEAKDGLRDISSKIRSIALIHEQLYRNNEFEYIDINVYFQELLAHFKEISKGGLLTLEYKISAEDVLLNLETAIPLGIAFSELVNNSIKHAKPSEGLLLQISLHEKEGVFTFKFKDNGLGFSEEYKDQPGLGLRLIKNMTRQLQGKLETFSENGANTLITFKQKVISKI